MYDYAVREENIVEACDKCGRMQLHMIDQFRLDVKTAETTMIFSNNLFTMHICLECLTHEINRRINEVRKDYKPKRGKKHIR